MTQTSLDSRRWVLPAVSLIPLLAIAFAFSLGPSPRKRLQAIYESDKVAQSQLVALAEKEPRVLEALVEDVQRPDVPHRQAIIQFIADRRFKPAVPALRRLVTTPTEVAPVRTEALKALKRIDPQGMRDLVRGLIEESGPLGRAAREVLAELSSGQS